jgi:hypothetical protein
MIRFLERIGLLRLNSRFLSKILRGVSHFGFRISSIILIFQNQVSGPGLNNAR